MTMPRNRKAIWIGFGLVLFYLTCLMPKPWLVSGNSKRIPFEILLFDAETGTPVPSAKLTLFRMDPLDWGQGIPTETLLPVSDERRAAAALSNADGRALVDYQVFRRFNDRWIVFQQEYLTLKVDAVWILVEADGYGSFVMPASSQPMIAPNREPLEPCLVRIGLVRNRSE